MQEQLLAKDIESQKAEQKIQKAREYAESIVETVRVPLIVLSHKLRVISANQSFYRVFKVSPQETVGEFIYDLGNRQWNIPGLRHLLEKILPDNKFFEDYEISHDFKAIGPRDMLLNARRLDSVQMILLSIEDITDRKKSENKLRNSEIKYKALFMGAPDGMLAVRTQTKQIIYANPAACRMFGYAEEEFVQKRVMDLHPKKFMSYVLACFKAEKKDVNRVLTNLACLRQDGSVFYVDVSWINIILDGEDCILGIFNDITQRMQAQEALRRSEKELKDDKVLLVQKNLALKELLEHMEREKDRMREDVAINVEEFIEPILKKLAIKGVSPKYLELLEQHLKELTLSFGRKITNRRERLTSREIEISSMIKGNLTSKDIAGLLNVSCQTIEKHRKNIRKKMGLSNKKANLASYLQKI